MIKFVRLDLLNSSKGNSKNRSMAWLGKMEQSDGRKEQKTGGKGNFFLICSYLFSECIEGMIFLCGNFMPKDQRLKFVATEEDQVSNTVIPAQLCVHTV